MPYTPFVATYKSRVSLTDECFTGAYRGQVDSFSWDAGFYVCLFHDGHEYLAPMCFARERDAAMAAAAVNRLTDWSTDTDTLRHQIQSLGWDALQRTMIEALQW